MGQTGHAVVIGASIGGLLAARALSQTYARVTLVDRDVLPDEPAHRRGTPQSRHTHALLAGGLHALEELFPGFSQELTDLGVPSADLQEKVDWYNDGYRLCPGKAGLTVFGVSRPLLEYAIRNRVFAIPGVRVMPACEVTGLITTPDASRVTGVRVHHRADGAVPSDKAAPSDIATDLVVDAGGRGSRTPVWLEEMGYSRAPEESVRIGLTYVTRQYGREPHHLGGGLGAGGGAYPGMPRTGGVFAQDGGRFTLTLAGMLGEEPPTDDDGMVAYAEKLPVPQVAEIIRQAQPLDAPAKMRYPSSTRRRYERLRRFPAGYLVVADALCNFNPIYGQGMTVAAREALLLRRLLAQGTDGLAKRFFREAARLLNTPWSLAAGADLRFPEVEGRRPASGRLVNAYISRFHAAATTDPVLGRAFLRVVNMLDSPRRLFTPGMLRRVLFAPAARPRVPHSRVASTGG